MQASATDSAIRGISLIRRIGSIFVVGIIFLFLLADCYHRIGERFRVSDLRNIHNNGVSTLATIQEEYEILTINHRPQLTFTYSFTENGRTYSNEYKLLQFLPKEPDALRKIFTVHYLKNDPDENSLNVEDEIKRIEKDIEESSVFWLIFKILATLIIGLILLGQVRSLISEIKNISQPIEVPDYLKKQS